jgi:hypothetical protein
MFQSILDNFPKDDGPDHISDVIFVDSPSVPPTAIPAAESIAALRRPTVAVLNLAALEGPDPGLRLTPEVSMAAQTRVLSRGEL